MLLENSGLIWSIVRRYYGCGVETDDLYQLGCIGFIKAVKGFDLTYGTQFSTYAVPKIAGEIRRFLRDNGAIKVGRSIREKGQALAAARERLRHRLGRDPRLSELAEETGLTPEEIASVELATGAPESLQQETAEGLTLESTLGTDSPEERMVEHIALREAIDQLPEREKMTILLRFFKGLTQEQTARILGVSQVQISRLERRGLAISGSCWTAEALVVHRKKFRHDAPIPFGEKRVLTAGVGPLPDGYGAEKLLPQGTVLKLLRAGQLQRQAFHRDDAALALGVQQQLPVGAVVQEEGLPGHAAAEVVGQQRKHPVPRARSRRPGCRCNRKNARSPAAFPVHRPGDAEHRRWGSTHRRPCRA